MHFLNRQTDSSLHQNIDMTTFGTRLRACRKGKSLTQKEVCMRVGIKQGTLSELENDKYPTSTYTPHLASLYGVEALWLAEGRGKKLREDPQEIPGEEIVAYDLEDRLSDRLVLIPEYNISFNTENGHVVYEAEQGTERGYERSWMTNNHINNKKAKRFKVRGDSMEPTLYDGDSVLVNEGESENIVDGKVYALRYGNELWIKRLFKKLDGSLILHSDNTVLYQREELSPEMVDENITIIGRVRDKSGKGGL